MSTDATTNHDHSDDHAHSHHITPVSKLVGVFITLTVLMLATIFWAEFAATLPPSTATSILNNIIAMGIACGKAFLVIQIFMGVKWASNLVKTYVILGFAWASLMTFVFIDYTTRRSEPVKGWSDHGVLGLPRDNEPAEYGMPQRDKIKVDTSGD